ncbi:MAG: MEKHLA domain-containing protein [Oscillatoriales cyanobacterium C42_A2020_001]|nr:MEKHLA domain-containing protein [Leptolyngbyaceae cyanobacterium C42_A2020_001]
MQPWQQPPIIHHTQRLLTSFQHWTGQPLLQVSGTPEFLAQTMFEAPFVVVSHGIQTDPIFNYGNQIALNLWELDWQQFTQTPSRLTAEPTERADRELLLQQAKQQGFISNYAGVRISRSGQRFRIRNVILWDVLDEQGDRCGQAATFDQWEML